MTVSTMLAECARDLSGTFTRKEIVSWFRRHYPDVKESTLSAHIQAYTANATNRERHHPGLAGRTPLFVRVGHGQYQRFDSAKPTMLSPADERPDAMPDATGGLVEGGHLAVDEWSWEGNVQAALVAHLTQTGWSIVRVANTARREHGTDIEARRNADLLFVEVKGWPSTRYVDPSRAGERKPTSPTVMARAWFADGLMHALRLKSTNPQGIVWLALPSYDTYRRLWAGLAPAARNAGMTVVWVFDDGTVETDAMPQS